MVNDGKRKSKPSARTRILLNKDGVLAVEIGGQQFTGEELRKIRKWTQLVSKKDGQRGDF